MLLFTILLLMFILLMVISIAAISALGTVGIIIFGDVIVCVVFIALLMKLIIKKKKGR